jgi:hypothetical protein
VVVLAAHQSKFIQPHHFPAHSLIRQVRLVRLAAAHLERVDHRLLEPRQLR